jgi:hypothetical protein
VLLQDAAVMEARFGATCVIYTDPLFKTAEWRTFAVQVMRCARVLRCYAGAASLVLCCVHFLFRFRV